MIVRVLLFGPQARLAQADSIEVSIAASDATADSLLSAIGDQHQALKESLGSSRIAINHDFASPSDPIGQLDEIALIGMVSGG